MVLHVLTLVNNFLLCIGVVEAFAWMHFILVSICYCTNMYTHLLWSCVQDRSAAFGIQSLSSHCHHKVVVMMWLPHSGRHAFVVILLWCCRGHSLAVILTSLSNFRHILVVIPLSSCRRRHTTFNILSTSILPRHSIVIKLSSFNCYYANIVMP